MCSFLPPPPTMTSWPLRPTGQTEAPCSLDPTRRGARDQDGQTLPSLKRGAHQLMAWWGHRDVTDCGGSQGVPGPGFRKVGTSALDGTVLWGLRSAEHQPQQHPSRCRRSPCGKGPHEASTASTRPGEGDTAEPTWPPSSRKGPGRRESRLVRTGRGCCASSLLLSRSPPYLGRRTSPSVTAHGTCLPAAPSAGDVSVSR